MVNAETMPIREMMLSHIMSEMPVSRNDEYHNFLRYGNFVGDSATADFIGLLNEEIPR